MRFDTLQGVFMSLLSLLVSGCLDGGMQTVQPSQEFSNLAEGPVAFAAQLRTSGAYLDFTSAAQSVAPNACSAAVRVGLFTSSGAANTFKGSVGVPISSDSNNVSFYTDSACSTPITMFVLNGKTASGKFYFKASASGSVNISINLLNLVTATQTENVTGGIPLPTPTPTASATPVATPPPGSTPFGDGSANAPTGAPQHPRLFSDNNEAVRPAWKVAGVDYKVGIPDGMVLKDPAISPLPTGVSLSGNTLRMDGTTNVTIDGYDFSKISGFSIYVANANGVRITHCRFFGGVPVNMAANSSDVYFGYNEIDGGGANGAVDFGELLVLGNGATVEYNWIRNAPQHFLSVGGGGSVIYRYNLLEEGAMTPGAHLNFLQFGGGTFNNPIVLYNTIIQHPQVSGGEMIQMYTNSTGTIVNGEVAYNTMMALPGASGQAVSYMLHLGSNAQYSNSFTGTAHDNYLDFTSTYGPIYGGLAGFTYSNNINLKNGALIMP